MAVVIVCGVLLALALVAALRWRHEEFLVPPAPAPDASRTERLRHHLWWVQVMLLTALAAGIFVMGIGGRLAMRLLGATAGDAAQGRLTEADRVVGEITVRGTIEFVFFLGVLSGLVTTAIWFAARRFLPARWPGGVLFGTALLVVLGTRMEPLRPGNSDFDLLGPWWLSIATFAALALGFGVALSSFSARFSRWLPVPGRDRRSLVYVTLLVLVALFPFGLAALATGLVYVFGGRLLAGGRAALTGATGLRAVRLALGVAVAIATPGFLLAIGDLVGRGP